MGYFAGLGQQCQLYQLGYFFWFPQSDWVGGYLGVAD